MTPAKEVVVDQLANQTIYLMGISFILGSLFTIFLLLILDMVRHSRSQPEESLPDDDDTDQAV